MMQNIRPYTTWSRRLLLLLSLCWRWVHHAAWWWCICVYKRLYFLLSIYISMRLSYFLRCEVWALARPCLVCKYLQLIGTPQKSKNIFHHHVKPSSPVLFLCFFLLLYFKIAALIISVIEIWDLISIISIWIWITVNDICEFFTFD